MTAQRHLRERWGTGGTQRDGARPRVCVLMWWLGASCCACGRTASELAQPRSGASDCAASFPNASATPARWRCELAAAESSAAADAARGGHRVRWRSYNKQTASGRGRAKPYGGLAARHIFEYFGWEETRGDDWDLLWTGRGQYDFLRQAGLRREPAPGRRHNHCFPSGLLAGNKKSLVKRINSMVDWFGRAEFEHVPQTFELPYQYDELIEIMESESRPIAGTADAVPKSLWILKPTLGARGEGIELLWNASQVPPSGENTVQRYISDAYLIDGRKIHLRLYLAITSLEPLRLLLLRDGLVLFASAPYELSPQSLQTKQVHLTNAAIAYPSNAKGRRLASATSRKLDALDDAYDNGNDPARSRLTWSLRPFLQHLDREGADVVGVWRRVEAALIKTVLAAQALQRLPHRHPGSCVDLFGVDVMFDQNLRPYVLEVNLAPALNSAEPGVNRDVHDRVLLHTIALLSRRHIPSEAEITHTRERLRMFAIRHGYSFCRNETEQETATARSLAYKAPTECIDDAAVAEVWRLSQETTELGLWDRIYPREDAGDGELTLRALTILARYALAARPALTKQHDSTRYERGRSLRTVLDEQWPESRHRWPTRLTASWAEHELNDTQRALNLEQWVQMLLQAEADQRGYNPARVEDLAAP